MLKALVYDNIGVDRVEFKVDGNLIGTDSSNPYSVLWENTGAYAPGSHTIEAIAVDSAAKQDGRREYRFLHHGGPRRARLDIQIDDGGVPRTSCGSAPSPCNVGP